MRQLCYALVLGLILAGCQSKQMPAAAPQSPASVTIRARDFAFDAPAEIPAGITTFHLVNDGPGLHHALLVRLDSGKTVADLVAALHTQGAMPAWAKYVGGPNVPDPGKESVATLDLEPGNYAMLCILDMPGGVPHYLRGMSRALTVTAAPATTAATPKAVAPIPDNAITLSDMVFVLHKPITAGTHTFQVMTAPGQPHEVLVVHLDPGKTGQDYVNWTRIDEGPGAWARHRRDGCCRPRRRASFYRDLRAGRLPADLPRPGREERETALHGRDDAHSQGELSKWPDPVSRRSRLRRQDR